MIKSQRKTHPVAKVLLALIGLYAACSYALFPAYAHTQEDMIREAVLRKYMREARGRPLFVSIDDASPSNGFLRRFSVERKVVRKPSEGVYVPDPYGDAWLGHYIDKASGGQGKDIGLGRIYWYGPLVTEVEVDPPGFSERVSVVLNFYGWTVTHTQIGSIA